MENKENILGIFKGCLVFVLSFGIQNTLVENVSLMKDVFAGIAQFTIGIYTVIQIIKSLKNKKQ